VKFSWLRVYSFDIRRTNLPPYPSRRQSGNIKCGKVGRPSINDGAYHRLLRYFVNCCWVDTQWQYQFQFNFNLFLFIWSDRGFWHTGYRTSQINITL